MEAEKEKKQWLKRVLFSTGIVISLVILKIVLTPSVVTVEEVTVVEEPFETVVENQGETGENTLEKEKQEVSNDPNDHRSGKGTVGSSTDDSLPLPSEESIKKGAETVVDVSKTLGKGLIDITEWGVDKVKDMDAEGVFDPSNWGTLPTE